MNYQQLIESLSEQLARLADERKRAVERARNTIGPFTGDGPWLERSDSLAALERLRQVNAQLSELASALGAVARASSSDRSFS